MEGPGFVMVFLAPGWSSMGRESLDAWNVNVFPSMSEVHEEGWSGCCSDRV